MLRPGQLLEGKFRIERPLGEGGMGVVMLAHHEGLGERVVLKVLRGDLARSPENLERLRREARTMARLHSEHVARVMDVGALDDGSPYLVLEYVRGETLRQRLEGRGALPIREGVDLMLQACEGLAEAHALGIIHRDLKPSNLMLTERPDGSPSLKLLDFGIAKTSGPTMNTLTENSSLLGSPLYMSPEQVRDAHGVSARSDVWALGVTLFEVLLGRLPFQAYTTASVIAAVLSDDPTPPRQIQPDFPAELEALLLRCLSRDPSARFDDVGQLALALAPFGSSTAAESAERACRTLRRGPPPADPPPSPTPEPPPVLASEPLSLTASRTATQHRTSPPLEPPPTSSPRPRRGLWLGLAAAASVVAALLLRPRAPADLLANAAPAGATATSAKAASAAAATAPASAALSSTAASTISTGAATSAATANSAAASAPLAALPSAPSPPVAASSAATPPAWASAPLAAAIRPPGPSANPPPRLAPAAPGERPLDFGPRQ